MRKHIFLIIVGITVYCVPFLGLPETWKAILLYVLGAAIVITALLFRFSARKRERMQSEIYFEEKSPLNDINSAVEES